MFGCIKTDPVGGPHHVADPDIRLGGQFSMLSIANAAYAGLVADSQRRTWFRLASVLL